MSYQMDSSQQPKKSRFGCGSLILFVFIAAVLFSAVRYIMDKSIFTKGHQAYQQADCAAAISLFDKVINGWRLVDFGGYPALSQREKAECIPFQAAASLQQAGDYGKALVAYLDFVTNYHDSVLANSARSYGASLFDQAKPSALASPESCEKVDDLVGKAFIPQVDRNLPPFYLACGQAYDTANNFQKSFAMYELLLTKYPKHALASEGEASLLANPAACEEAVSLGRNRTIANRTEFMPKLYYGCGKAYEDQRDWTNAVDMYEKFLAAYPSHTLASDVETALARSIVMQAKAAGAGEIPMPQSSGSTGSGVTDVIIQNDSPERLRIVFSGPESHVEELGACSSCTNYTNLGPMYCPEKGPIGTYTLKPGQYDVVVESINDSGTTPWSGNWDLVDGDEYFNCFFVVTTTFGQ